MSPCWRLIALAQMSGISRSTSSEVVRMLASRSVPMRDDGAVEVGHAELAQRLDVGGVGGDDVGELAATRPGRPSAGASMAEHLGAPAGRAARASELPKRPSPMTTTGSVRCVSQRWFSPRVVRSGGCARAARARRPRVSGPDPADEHQQRRAARCPRRGQVGGDAGGQPDGGERGDRLEQHPVQADAGSAPAARTWQPRPAPTLEQRDGERLALVLARACGGGRR